MKVFELKTIPRGTILYRSDEAFQTDGDERIRQNKPLYLFEEYTNAQAYGHEIKEYELTRTLHVLPITEANIRNVIARLKSVDHITTSKGAMSSDDAIRIILTYLSNGDKIDAIKENVTNLVWANVFINTTLFPPSLKLDEYENSLAHAVGYVLCSLGIDGIHNPGTMKRLQGIPFHEEILVCNPQDCVRTRLRPPTPSFTGTITCATSLGSVRITNVTLRSVNKPFLTFATNPESTFHYKGNDKLGIEESKSTFEIHEYWLIEESYDKDDNDNQELLSLLSSLGV